MKALLRREWAAGNPWAPGPLPVDAEYEFVKWLLQRYGQLRGMQQLSAQSLGRAIIGRYRGRRAAGADEDAERLAKATLALLKPLPRVKYPRKRAGPRGSRSLKQE